MQRSALLWDDFFIQLGNWEHWVAASFLTLPLIPFLFLLLRFAFSFFFPLLFSFACARQKQYGGDQLHAAERRRGVGWEGGGGDDDGAEGGLGLQSLKISRAAECEAGPRHSSGVPSISAILVAFSISEVCLIS